jgi:hypothetical protein
MGHIALSSVGWTVATAFGGAPRFGRPPRPARRTGARHALIALGIIASAIAMGGAIYALSDAIVRAAPGIVGP